MSSVRIPSNYVRFFILFLITLEKIRFEVKAQRISSQEKNDNYKDELFKEMAKVFKILQEHPITENPLNISTQYSSLTGSEEKKNYDSSNKKIQNKALTTESDSMFTVSLERKGMKRARSVDLISKANLKNNPPLTEINPTFLNGEISIDSYTEGLGNKWIDRKYRFRRFNNHPIEHRKIWRQISEQYVDPGDNVEWIPFRQTTRYKNERKSRKSHTKTPAVKENREIFSAFNNIRDNFKKNYTTRNSSHQFNDDTEGRKYAKYPRHNLKYHSNKFDVRGKHLNYFNHPTDISTKLFNWNYGTSKKVLEDTKYTTPRNFHVENITQAKQLVLQRKTYLLTNFSISTETNDHFSEHKIKRDNLEGLDLNQIESINPSGEDNTFIDQVLNYIQSHFLIAVSIFAISITMIIILGILAFYIGRKRAGRKENARKDSPAGVQSFDLPARPNINYAMNPKNKSTNERKEKDDGKSMFSIGSQSSMSEANSKDLIRSNKHKKAEWSNQEFSRLLRSTGNSGDPRKKIGLNNGLDNKAGERLLKLHRNFSSRSSILQSSGSQKSTKSSPVQRIEELEKFSRRAKTSPETESPFTPKPRNQTPVHPKTSSNPFEEKDETAIVKELQDLIQDVEHSSYVPPHVENKFTYVNRLLDIKPPDCNISPANRNNMGNTKVQNGDSKNPDKEFVKMSQTQNHSLSKHSDDSSKETSLKLDEFSDDEPGIDF